MEAIKTRNPDNNGNCTAVSYDSEPAALRHLTTAINQNTSDADRTRCSHTKLRDRITIITTDKVLLPISFLPYNKKIAQNTENRSFSSSRDKNQPTIEPHATHCHLECTDANTKWTPLLAYVHFPSRDFTSLVHP